MRKNFWFIVIGVIFLGGCAAMRDLLLPGNSEPEPAVIRKRT